MISCTLFLSDPDPQRKVVADRNFTDQRISLGNVPTGISENGRIVKRILSEKRDTAIVRLYDTGQNGKKRSLSASVGTRDPDDASACGVEGNSA